VAAYEQADIHAGGSCSVSVQSIAARPDRRVSGTNKLKSAQTYHCVRFPKGVHCLGSRLTREGLCCAAQLVFEEMQESEGPGPFIMRTMLKDEDGNMLYRPGIGTVSDFCSVQLHALRYR
jgi:hypothetical protein